MIDAEPRHFACDDVDSFEAVVQAYQNSIYNLCYKLLGEASAAEDATQETFLRAYHHLAGYDRQRPLQTWLFSIASHHCIDRLRRPRPIWLPVDDDVVAAHEPAPGPEGIVLRHELRDQIQELLGCLQPRDRCAIILRYWYDQSYVEIATVLGTTVSSVKSRLHRARHELGKRLAQASERECMMSSRFVVSTSEPAT